jgi:hypothetical protein
MRHGSNPMMLLRHRRVPVARLSADRCARRVVHNMLLLSGILRAVQLLLGHRKIESNVRHPGNEVDDALAIAEQVDV